MRGTGSERKRGFACVPVAVVALLAAAAVTNPQDAGKERDAMSRNHDMPVAVRPNLPDIDRPIPQRVETATFALG